MKKIHLSKNQIIELREEFKKSDNFNKKRLASSWIHKYTAKSVIRIFNPEEFDNFKRENPAIMAAIRVAKATDFMTNYGCGVTQLPIDEEKRKEETKKFFDKYKIKRKV